MENDRALYALGIHVLRHDAGRTLYGIDGGRGQIEDYGLYPGVSLQFNDIRCERLLLEEGVSSLLEMNYCAAGRYECEFRQGSCVRLQEGGFCACLRCACKVSSCFPTGRYRGISIMLDVKQAQRFMDGHYPELALALWQLPRQLSQIGRSSLSFDLPFSFEQAAAYRKANGQYVRKNQWRDTTVRVLIDLN